MSKKQQNLDMLRKNRNLPKLEYGRYVESYGYCGYLEKTDGDYIWIRTSKNLEGPFHCKSSIIYYDNPMDRNVIYEFKEVLAIRTHKEYQEALDYIKDNIKHTYNHNGEDYFNEDSIDALQGLIDESTPKKVVNKRNSAAYVIVIVGDCPKCGPIVTTVDKKPYQCYCRQELDWSDEQ